MPQSSGLKTAKASVPPRPFDPLVYAMAENARSRSRTRLPPLQPLHPPTGIAPPPRPRPRRPLQPLSRTKARSVGPYVPDINRQGPPHLMIHRSGTPAPKPPPELPPRYTPRYPKLIANYIKQYPKLPEYTPYLPKRTNVTNEFFAKRRTHTTTTTDSTNL